MAIELAACLWLAVSISTIQRQVDQWYQARPRFTQSDVQAAAVAATFEAQVLPEPLKSQAYRAIVWTMRNRVASGYNGVNAYSDERLLNRYVSYSDHKDDLPGSLALTIARQVLLALTNDDDPTKGARHYVDNSYWTGTHEQTASVPKFRGKYSDSDVQRLVEDGRFTYMVEWRSSPGHPSGSLFYGLYFFDSWPPPVPVPAPTPTPPATPPEVAAPPSTASATITPGVAAR